MLCEAEIADFYPDLEDKIETKTNLAILNSVIEPSGKSSDPDNHDIFYVINWGDGNNNDWYGPYNSGEEISINHTFAEGGRIYMNVKAIDQFNKEGETVHFAIFIIKNRAVSNPLFHRILSRLFEDFPRLQFFLDRIL